MSEDNIKYDDVLVNVPAEYVVFSKGTRFIKFAGLIYLAEQMGTCRLRTEILESDSVHVVIKCEGWIVPGDEYLNRKGFKSQVALQLLSVPMVAYGSCYLAKEIVATDAEGNPVKDDKGKFVVASRVLGNVNDNMKPYLLELAETRAKARCLRVLTGISATAYEEMGAELELQKAVNEQLATMEKQGKIVKMPEIESAMSATNIDFTKMNRPDLISSIVSMKTNSNGAKKEYCKYLDSKTVATHENLTVKDLIELAVNMSKAK